MTGLLMIFMVLTLGVLLAGVVLMGMGGEANRKYGNRLMVARVGLQAAAIGLVGLMFLMA